MSRGARIRVGLAALVVAVSACSGSGHRVAKGFVFFRPVLCVIPSYVAGSSPTALNAPPETACGSSHGASVPTTPVGDDTANSTVVVPSYDGSARYVLGPAELDATSIAKVTVQRPQTGNQGYTLAIRFTKKGASGYSLIGRAIGPYYLQGPAKPAYVGMEAIDVDGVAWEALANPGPSSDGSVIVAGASGHPFSKQEATGLATNISAAR